MGHQTCCGHQTRTSFTLVEMGREPRWENNEQHEYIYIHRGVELERLIQRFSEEVPTRRSWLKNCDLKLRVAFSRLNIIKIYFFLILLLKGYTIDKF